MKFKQGDIVVYRPFTEEEEEGIVSSCNEYYIFVRFMKQINKFGYDGATSQSCNPDDLILRSEYYGKKDGCCGKSCNCKKQG